jgi:hypothetical protein
LNGLQRRIKALEPRLVIKNEALQAILDEVARPILGQKSEAPECRQSLFG